MLTNHIKKPEFSQNLFFRVHDSLRIHEGNVDAAGLSCAFYAWKFLTQSFHWDVRIAVFVQRAYIIYESTYSRASCRLVWSHVGWPSRGRTARGNKEAAAAVRADQWSAETRPNSTATLDARRASSAQPPAERTEQEHATVPPGPLTHSRHAGTQLWTAVRNPNHCYWRRASKNNFCWWVFTLFSSSEWKWEWNKLSQQWTLGV